MACLRSPVWIFISPNYYYHSKYGILDYARNNLYHCISILLRKIVPKLMVFVQNSSALDEEEDVKSMEFGGGIKMKKRTRKFSFVLW